MTVNAYFEHLYNKSEQDFFEDFVVESIQIGGMDIYYIVRDYVTEEILQEPTRSNFEEAYKIEAYFHDVQGFGGEGDLMTKFGFQQADTVEISIAKRRWRELGIQSRSDRPREGDLIYLPFSKSLFEINFIEHEDPFWQLGRYNVFRLKASLYTKTYNEKFNVNIDIPEGNGDQSITDAGQSDNQDEINQAINNKIITRSNTLLDFSEKNPFGDL